MMPNWIPITLTFVGKPEVLDDIEEAAIQGHLFEWFLPTPDHLRGVTDKSNPHYVAWLQKTYGATTVRDWRINNWGSQWGDVDAHVLHREEERLVVYVYVPFVSGFRIWKRIARKLGVMVRVVPDPGAYAGYPKMGELST